MSIPPKSKDPFLMSEDKIVGRISMYLEKQGYAIEEFHKGFSHGIDIIACDKTKKSFFYIEAKGNIKNKNTEKIQFTSLQIAQHFDVQIGQLCQIMHKYRKELNVRFDMANPYVPRILNRVEVTRTALKLLPIELIWVTPQKVWMENS